MAKPRLGPGRSPTPLSPLPVRLWPPFALCAILTCLAAAAWFSGDRSFARTVTECLIDEVMVVGAYIFIGNSGLISFGHAGFMAIGAYAAAWQTVRTFIKASSMPGLPDFLLKSTVPALPAAILSGSLSAVTAAVIGVIILRLSGLAASIATFAFLGIVNTTYANWGPVTGGTSSIVGIPVYVNVWVALAWAACAVAVAYLFQTSRFGIALRSSREDEAAAQSCGVRIFPLRVAAFAVSAFFVGIAGVLQAHFLGVLFIDSFYLDRTFTMLAMLVVGGMQSLTGAVLGTLVITAVRAILLEFEKGVTLGALSLSIPSGAQEVGMATLIILILIVRRQGLMGGREISYPNWGLTRGHTGEAPHSAMEADDG